MENPNPSRNNPDRPHQPGRENEGGDRSDPRRTREGDDRENGNPERNPGQSPKTA